ncbi:MAG: DUF362 domain-containing protein [Pseudomonadota bacterium]
MPTEPSKVYFADLRANPKRSLNDKIDSLIQALNPAQRLKAGGLTAIKIHFGEKGNTAFIRPVLVRRFVDAVKALGCNPFLTDCNTLYVGTRAQAVSHLITATENGFAYSVVGAPLVIGDGLKGHSSTAVRVDLPECAEAHIGSEVVEADNLISLAHFKGHELAGFGGTIKNLGMGAASRRGKLFQHSNVSPAVAAKHCIACGECIMRCPASAIKLVKRQPEEKPPAGAKHPALRSLIDPQKCVGCGDCILVCPTGAIQIQWDAQIPEFLRRMVAYTKGVLQGKEERSLFFNFLTNISPACDCYPFQDAPIVADLGVVASLDPVALDQASVDLVNQAQGAPASELKHAHAPGQDKFRDIYPRVDWEIQLAYAQEIGLGSRSYELERV